MKMGQQIINEIVRTRTAMVTEERQFYPKIVESHYYIILDLFLHYHINAVRYEIQVLNNFNELCRDVAAHMSFNHNFHFNNEPFIISDFSIRASITSTWRRSPVISHIRKSLINCFIIFRCYIS